MSSSSQIEVPFVIIGGGISGISCAESISSLNENSPIVLITASTFVKAVTSITPLSKTLCEFHVEEKVCDSVSSQYSNLNIIVDTAVAIDAENQLVFTSSNRTIKYGKLCLCSGASPKSINSHNEHVIGIRDTDSAKLLESKLRAARRILIVGNGGIATELVYEIEGVDIVWAIKDNHITAAFIDPGAAEFFANSLEKNKHSTESVIKTVKYSEEGYKTSETGVAMGPSWHAGIILKRAGSGKVTVEYEAQVISISNEPPAKIDEEFTWPVYVTLSNGKCYGCDFVVSATGVKPNSDTIHIDNGDFSIANDGGIKVNEYMQTCINNIYAAGDVCTASWPLAKHWFQMRLWTQARQMGCYAGRCMVEAANKEVTIPDFCFEIFTHVTRFFGYKVILLGLFNSQKLEKNYELLLRVTSGKEFVKLVVSEGKLQGAVLIGETDLEEMCENLILNQLDISELGEDLLNPEIDIEDYFD